MGGIIPLLIMIAITLIRDHTRAGDLVTGVAMTTMTGLVIGERGNIVVIEMEIIITTITVMEITIIIVMDWTEGDQLPPVTSRQATMVAQVDSLGLVAMGG